MVILTTRLKSGLCENLSQALPEWTALVAFLSPTPPDLENSPKTYPRLSVSPEKLAAYLFQTVAKVSMGKVPVEEC